MSHPENESVYERIRREADEKAQAQRPQGKTLEERLDMVPVKGPNGESFLEERLNMRR